MDDNDNKLIGLNYRIILNPLVSSGDSYRAVVVDPVMIKAVQFNREVALALGIPIEEVQRVNSMMCQVASTHLQQGHGIETGLSNFEPTIKGALKKSETHIIPPKQHVDYKQRFGENMSVDMYSIPTHKVESNKKAPTIDQVEDGISETINEILTPLGTAIFTGENLHFDETAEDEGVFFSLGDTVVRSSKAYLNINSQVQVRIPDLAPAEHYRVELRKRFKNKKKLYCEVCETRFRVLALKVSG